MKEKLYEQLKTMLFERKDVFAANIGGSKATGFDDAFSDLDLEVICADDAVENVFAAVDELLQHEFGILRSYRLPEPTWHGFSQCFYLIDQMPKHFYIDLAVVKNSLENRLTDTKRHGKAFVWFDKDHYMIEKEDTEEETLARAKQFYKRAVSIDFLMMVEVEKNLDRNQYIEAYTAYYRFIMNQMVIMLNLKHRPYKVDFGMRYAYRDYDEKDYDFLVDALKNQSIEDIKDHYTKAKTYYESLKESLKQTYE